MQRLIYHSKNINKKDKHKQIREPKIDKCNTNKRHDCT